MSRHLLFPAHALRRLGALLLATALLVSLAPVAAADEVAPSTRASLEGDRSPDGWFRGPVEVHLDATDAGDDVVAATEYRVDDGEWQVLAGGAETIFDGTQASLDRWRMAGPGEFVLLPDGTMTTTGGMGMLWYPVEYGDIALELQFRDAKPSVFGGSNAGVFVRFPDVDDAASRSPAERHACQRGASEGDPVWVAVHCGHEIQINDAGSDPQKTGSVYNFASIGEVLAASPQGEWNDYRIEIRGGGDYEVVVIRNGEEINRWTNAPGQAPARQGDPGTDERQFGTGYIGLQNHGWADYVQFRDIRVERLEAPAPIVVTGNGEHVVAYRSTDAAGNVEDTQQVRFRIDTTAPAVSGAVDDGILELTADDSPTGSGIAAIQYRTEGGEWTSVDPAAVLFDGSEASLEDWTMSGPGSFEVTEDGAMRTVGGMGLLWYAGRPWGDAAIQLEWRDARSDDQRSNGGVFIRFPDPEEAVDHTGLGGRHACQTGLGLLLAEWVAVGCGHEVQVNDGDADPQRTGSLYNFASIGTVEAAADFGEWNRYEVRTVGDGSYRVTVVRNGEVINTFDNTPGQRAARPFDPPTDMRQFAEGYFGLQNHGAADTIEYRNVRVLPLDPRTISVPVPAGDGLEVRAVDLAGNTSPASTIVSGAG